MPHFFEFYSNQRQILTYEGNYQRLYHTFVLFSRSQELLQKVFFYLHAYKF